MAVKGKVLRQAGASLGTAPKSAKSLSRVTVSRGKKALPGMRLTAPPTGPRGAAPFKPPRFITAPPLVPSAALARRGKNMSRMVAGGVVGAAVIGTMSNRSGRAADKMGRGRPTGPYMF